jgi:hypothetical protein
VGGIILRSEATKPPGRAENVTAGILRAVYPERNEKDPSASPQDDSERAQNDSAGQSQHDKDVFWAFAKAGKELARLHIEYEKLEPWPLKFIETTAATECRPEGRRYNPALLSRGRQDAALKRPPLAQSERFPHAGRHSTRNH